eukprot:45526-Rhodomonas_salina.1
MPGTALAYAGIVIGLRAWCAMPGTALRRANRSMQLPVLTRRMGYQEHLYREEAEGWLCPYQNTRSGHEGGWVVTRGGET